MPTHESNWKDSLARLGKAFEVPDLRKRLGFVGFMFALFVVGLHVPAPFVRAEAMHDFASTGLGGMIDMLSGGAFKRVSILALGIVPYINASIIMQLLGIAVPSIQKMQKEGESGRKRLSSITRYGTVLLAIVQAAGIAFYFLGSGYLNNMGLDGWAGTIIPVLVLVIVLTAGTSFLMWMGEQITDRGIGNGVSLIIFAGIMIRLPDTFAQIVNYAYVGSDKNLLSVIWKVGLIAVVFVAIVVFITWVHQATRQLPIQHAKRVVGNRVFSSSNTYLPLKIITAGVIPIIFAISLVMLPGTIAGFLESRVADGKGSLALEIMRMFSPGYHGDLLTQYVRIGNWEHTFHFGPIIGGVTYFLLVFFFTYFYTAVVYNVQDIADNLKKHGSFIPGLRPGKQTEQYIDKVLTRITFAGGIILGLIALLPYLIPAIIGGEAQLFTLWGGTSLLIVVGVALESMKQIEAHLVMRHYEGFIK